MSLAVSTSDVTRDFGTGESRVRALRGVDFEVHAGEITLLVGPSGCGKTTLLSVISGLLPPSGGDIEVLGRDIHSLTGQDKVRFRGEHFGFVFQQHHLLPSLNAKENCAIPSVINGASRKNATEAACELLQQVGLGHRIDADPATLSGGEQQRVAVARALVHEPRLVMCDEPTASLDAESGKQVMQLLRGVAVSEDRAVIVVTHDQRLFDFADRLARMDDGRIVSVE